MKGVIFDRTCNANTYISVWAVASSVCFIYVLLQGSVCDVRTISAPRIKTANLTNVNNNNGSDKVIGNCNMSCEPTAPAVAVPIGHGYASRCLSDVSEDTFRVRITKCKERGVKHLLFTGDSRTRDLVVRTLGEFSQGASCSSGACVTEQYYGHCNYHCSGPYDLVVDFWWIYRLNDSLVDIFRHAPTSNQLRYNNMKRPDVVLITAGLHESLTCMSEVEKNLTKLLPVLSEWNHSAVFYVQQPPVTPNTTNKHGIIPYHVTVLNLIASSILANFPKIHYIEGLWDIAAQDGTFRSDGIHYESKTNKCFFLHILREICEV